MNPDHNIDRNIDRVIDALNNAAPPAGMERRILNVLGMEACRPAQSTRSRLRFSWMIAAACGAALVVASLIGIFAMLRHPAPLTAITETLASQPSYPSRSPVTADSDATAVAPTPRSHIAPAKHSAKPSHTKVAQSEETPVSHPAPPIPLTEQERILLRYARHGKTSDLAQISNESKSAKEDQEKQEFQAFFELPPIKIGESE